MKKSKMEANLDKVRMLAEQGDADAQYDLGWAYFSGELVKSNGDLALHWFKKAAMQGHPGGMWRVGSSYEMKDDEQAVSWYRKAAEAGHPHAQWWLGVKYYRGEGVEQDIQLALYWFNKAAELNEAAACKQLGWLYECGECVDQDWQLSSHWYKKAADSYFEEMLRLVPRPGSVA